MREMRGEERIGYSVDGYVFLDEKERALVGVL